MGLVVVAYVCVIGVTGAALVFRPEMQKATFAAIFDPNRQPGAADAEAGTIVANLQGAYPLYSSSGSTTRRRAGGPTCPISPRATSS